MFTAKSFTYDGKSSDDFGLQVYYLDNQAVTEDPIWESEIAETRLASQIAPLFFGLNVNKPLTWSFVVGSMNTLEREQIDEIMDWLTSSDTYKWLEIDQDDMSGWRYKALIQNVQLIHFHGLATAFRCTVVCDSQFAYEYPLQYAYQIEDGVVKNAAGKTLEKVVLRNDSAFSGYLYPKMELYIPKDSETFTVVNESDGNRPFTIRMPKNFAADDGSEELIVKVDNKNQIITCNSSGINIYDCFGDEENRHYFFRLVKGDNILRFTGSGLLKIECEFLRKGGM
ncbi:phage tail domain-containing protein [Senimuribacter intestinalis]|uniref:phage tail domain-containing protein n=1 Tax=Senimuribacter intestinalis TaxID=2941507 RepID=UPI00203C5B33|nr:phage tail domain-containing protein [Senimuribacter intestinalis]